jgi:hypothetical protein
MAHWYSRSGELISEIAMTTKAGMRPTDIRDARKLDLVPSVTTVLDVVDKPSIRQWSHEQVVKACISEPYLDSQDTEQDYTSRILAKADEYRRYTADFGTEIHNQVCRMLGGAMRPVNEMTFLTAKPIAERVCEWLRENDYEVIDTERTVVNEDLGLAGTIDLRSLRHGKKVIADFKSNEFETESKCPFYREHQWQAALYDCILDHWADERHIIYVSRKKIGLVVAKVCTEPTKNDEAALAIYEAWKKVNSWP